MSLLFNMLPRLVITFLPRSKHILISWLQSPSAVILEPKRIKSATVSTVSPSISHEVMGPDAMILIFWMLSFKPTFSLSYFTFIKRLFSSSSVSAIRVVSSAYLRLLIFLLAILIPACAFSSPEFLMMYSAYKLNKQGYNATPELEGKVPTTGPQGKSQLSILNIVVCTCQSQAPSLFSLSSLLVTINSFSKSVSLLSDSTHKQYHLFVFLCLTYFTFLISL